MAVLDAALQMSPLMKAMLSHLSLLVTSFLTPAIGMFAIVWFLVVVLASWYLVQQHQQRQQEAAVISVKGLSSLIQSKVNNYRLVSRSISNHHQDRILIFQKVEGIHTSFQRFPKRFLHCLLMHNNL
ncbi:hypothetical protein [Thiomicrorhabdus aquaedulcis]|uniref:hypothetical protein n=1 Tax=Thiomicrorhabdus aquaedulcis TaxID=2211106 RepID=UPI000FD9683F|nr:hypothetical protein [Thiomicrorhabdus aquaedulcis]